ncbi:hypothetical protein [Pannonibacter sp.]
MPWLDHGIHAVTVPKAKPHLEKRNGMDHRIKSGDDGSGWGKAHG